MPTVIQCRKLRRETTRSNSDKPYPIIRWRGRNLLIFTFFCFYYFASALSAAEWTNSGLLKPSRLRKSVVTRTPQDEDINNKTKFCDGRGKEIKKNAMYKLACLQNCLLQLQSVFLFFFSFCVFSGRTLSSLNDLWELFGKLFYK